MLTLELVDHRAAQARTLAHLLQAQNLDRGSYRGRSKIAHVVQPIERRVVTC